MTRWLALMILVCGPVAAQVSDARSRVDQKLDQLFGMLKVAPDEAAAAAIESAIQTQWFTAASPAIRLLLSRGAREVNEGAASEAVEDFDAALDLDPNLVAAWQGRATARWRAGDTAGAERDIAETMKREPRQFAALEDLSRIAEARGDFKGAYAAWQQALELDPKTPGGAERQKDLKRRAFGDET